MVSPGYLRGKVVLLDCRDYADPANADALKRLQTVWATYKTKQFVVLGSHRGKAGQKKVRAVMDRLGLTFPVYGGAELAGGEGPGPNGPGQDGGGGVRIYVVDSTCSRRLYAGADDRVATGVVGGAIMAARMPSSARQWKFLLDYEIENLPGQAYLRLKDLAGDAAAWADMKSAFPEDARRYEAAREKFAGDNEVKRLAKLVEIARLVKDRDTDSAQAKKMRPEHLERIEEKYGSLKKSENPYVAQEAKNALVDILFAKTEIERKKKK